MVQTLEDPKRGSLKQLRLPVAAPSALPPPSFGEHTRSFLTEAGFSDEELAALVDAGATRL
jgi:alpha-methylacyl-CoA racemase